MSEKQWVKRERKKEREKRERKKERNVAWNAKEYLKYCENVHYDLLIVLSCYCMVIEKYNSNKSYKQQKQKCSFSYSNNDNIFISILYHLLVLARLEKKIVYKF